MNSGLVFLQFLLLRRRFRPIQLLQLPVLLVFGVLNDIALWATSWVGHTAYWQQWVLVLLAIVVLAVGIVFQIAARSIMLAGEATVLTIATELARVFGERKWTIGSISTWKTVQTLPRQIQLGTSNQRLR